MPPNQTHELPPRYAAALEAFRPERIGFQPYHAGWVKEIDGLGPVAVAPLGWQHVHSPSYDYVDGERLPTDALTFLVRLQALTWGMPPELLVPSNLLAVLPDSGSAILAAYDPRKGFNADGWLGFIIAAGSSTGTLVSHMLGVREEIRGINDVGWYLKVIQGYLALASGHTAAIWTFDPMRGMNARLNLEKLGAVVKELTVDKYGALPSSLYGEVPSDRLTAHWDLTAPATGQRISDVAAGRYRGLTLADVAAIPEATPHSLAALQADRPLRIKYRIPGDVDDLFRTDPAAAVEWRRAMRQVLSAFITTKSARHEHDPADGPLSVEVDTRIGAYVISGFATGRDEAGQRRNDYILERKPSTTSEEPL